MQDIWGWHSYCGLPSLSRLNVSGVSFARRRLGEGKWWPVLRQTQQQVVLMLQHLRCLLCSHNDDQTLTGTVLPWDETGTGEMSRSVVSGMRFRAKNGGGCSGSFATGAAGCSLTCSNLWWRDLHLQQVNSHQYHDYQYHTHRNALHLSGGMMLVEAVDF